MRDLPAAHFANAPAPQAPARNASPPPPPPPPSPPGSLRTFDSHRRRARPRLRSVFRAAPRRALSRIDETPPASPRARSKSLQHSADFSSTRRVLRSRSNISADTSRSVPVCNQSQDAPAQRDSSPQYEEPKGSDSSFERPASMMDLPIVVPLDPATGAYIPYPEYSYYRDDGRRLARYRQYNKKAKKYSSKHSNLYLAFMY